MIYLFSLVYNDSVLGKYAISLFFFKKFLGNFLYPNFISADNFCKSERRKILTEVNLLPIEFFGELQRNTFSFLKIQ